MDRSCRAKLVSASLAVAAVSFGWAGPLSAQAWPPAKGEGTVTVTYENHYALWIATVSGKGGAHIARMLAVGSTWTFAGRLKSLAGD